MLQVKHMDFDDPKMIDNVIKNSNVVINLIGIKQNHKIIIDTRISLV